MHSVRLFLLLLLFLSNSYRSFASFTIKSLKVEYTETPLGIDIKIPRFSWQMNTAGLERDYSQSACQIVVSDPKGKEMWDSKKITNNNSLNIQYAGNPLQPTTRYIWTITVWDQNGKMEHGSSWFETGLMNPDPKLAAWNGATWIGGTADDMVLYSPSLAVFKLSCSLKLDKESRSTRAGFLFGANDSRLLDKNKNILQVESKINESYIKFELDISKVDGSESGLAQLNVYRVGYHPDDTFKKPFKAIPVPNKLINNNNKYELHEIYTMANFGLFEIYIDGNDQSHLITNIENLKPAISGRPKLNLNPVGYGHDYIAFPMLGSIGFSLDPGQKATFSGLEVRNYRSPSNKLFSEDLNNPGTYTGVFSKFANRDKSGLRIADHSYVLEGGENGVVIIADPSKNSMPILRTTFNTEKKIAQARLYATARGIYELYINGQRVGNDYFNPGLTQYNKTHFYQTYDVTKMVRNGKNAIGALLGEGWWSGNITYSGENWNFFGDRQSLLAKLVVTYTDGTTKIITTNPGLWSYYNDGPLVYGSFFQGEVYDASKESAISGWNTPDYDDHKWAKAVRISLEGNSYPAQNLLGGSGNSSADIYDNMSLIGQIGENASVVKELTAIGVEEVRPGVFVYDMGQNMVGVPQISINNGLAGKKLTLRYAEVKYPALAEYGKNVGMIMLENIRGALTQDTYLLKGGNEVIQPRFTFHGYRFIEITGIEKALPVASVKGKVISSVKELASAYETSNPKVNKLWENIIWSTRGNFLSIPTDCPQRNERMGWNGDISVFSRTATYLVSVPQFLRRHMLNMRDDQREDGRFTDVAPLGGGFGGILWGSAGITVAWESYQQYGDRDLIAEHYDAMKKYLSYLSTRIDPMTNVMNEGPLGDWLSPEGNKNDNTLFWESYYIYDLEVMAKIADVLGKTEDASGFREIRIKRKEFFNNTYVDEVTKKTVRSGTLSLQTGTSGAKVNDKGNLASKKILDTQASYAIPLALGVFSSDNEPYAAKHLASAVMRKNIDDKGAILPEYGLMTGFIGTAWISKALSDHGYNDIAFRLLQQTSYPSWLYSVDQGATTIWERLNSYTAENGFGGNNSMNSFSHYSFGAVGAWMYNYSLGIQRDESEPGFKHFILQPIPDPAGRMTFAKGHYDSMYGRIESGWKLEKGNLIYSATVPANTTATLYLPAVSEKEITENGKSATLAKGIKFLKCEKGNAIFELGSGRYIFYICNQGKN
jgi:alpha-L-rhamnosidase